MDTGSTLYKRLQRTLAKRKRTKNKARAMKIAASRRENQRKRNEENGHGYLTDNELKARVKGGLKSQKNWRKGVEKKRKEGLERYHKRKRAEKREKEREIARERKAIQHKKEVEKRREQRKLATIGRRKRKRANERTRKRILKHPIWILNFKPYKVYVAVNGHCMKNGYLGQYKTVEEAKQRVDELREAEKNVIFERQTKTYFDGTMKEVYEYVIFKNVLKDEPKSTYLKNEFGKYVEHTVSYHGKNYEMVDKFPAKVEDTVWVFGYDPRNDRKTFSWVFDNVLNTGFSSSVDLKRIYLYHNKIVFRNDENKIDIVICKTASDAVRFYNTLREYCKKGPYLFMGAVTTKNALCGSLEELLLEKTGWHIKKLRRNQHRF